MTSNRFKLLSHLESIIGYSFSNRRLLTEALTQPSYVSENRRTGMSDNQRLEFFGDAVLSFIVSNRLFELFPDSNEGSLTRMRASLVGTETLAGLAEGIRLGSFLRVSRGEDRNGGRARKSVLADAFEALVAAVYLDGGISCAEQFVDRQFAPLLAGVRQGGDDRDFKTKLQELSHSMRCRPPIYIVNDVTGPDHDLHFTVTVIVGEECFGRGTGNTRKAAEQLAAREGLLLLEEERKRVRPFKRHFPRKNG
jgi:ribonuclease III